MPERASGQPMKHYSVSVIIPVGLRESRAALCLERLCGLSPPVDEIILVCDGANQSARDAAASFGVRLVELPRRLGPAYARNQGAFAATSDVLLFVDADVLVPFDVVNEILRVLDSESDVAACFGSYDDTPAEPNFLSQYKNLFHHFVHQNSPSEASTFWTGCGAIFRHVFQELGGFNEAFGLPSVEDIEFGYRLRDAGHKTRLVHSLQVKHLKRWEVRSLLRTDFLLRAIPWGRLVVALLAAVSLIFLNLRLYRFFRRKRGLLFMSGAVLWNWLYYLYGSLGFGIALLQHWAARWKPAARHSDDNKQIGAQLPLD